MTVTVFVYACVVIFHRNNAQTRVWGVLLLLGIIYNVNWRARVCFYLHTIIGLHFRCTLCVLARTRSVGNEAVSNNNNKKRTDIGSDTTIQYL